MELGKPVAWIIEDKGWHSIWSANNGSVYQSVVTSINDSINRLVWTQIGHPMWASMSDLLNIQTRL